MENVDRNKYGTVLTGLVSQFLLGQDQYPRELTSAMNVLSNHKFDPAYQEAKKKQNNKSSQKGALQKSHEKQSSTPIEELLFA